jgi:hypothetical protein
LPATATGFGPHDVLYTSGGTKSVKLVIDPNYPVQSCPDSSTVTFSLNTCTGNIAGNVRTIDGEAIGNVLVLLFVDADADGVPDDPSTPDQFVFTTSSGTYAFVLLDPGNYVVQEFQPDGFESVQDIDQSIDFDSVANVVQTDDLIPVTVQPLVSDFDNNFIERILEGSITGSVMEDFNSNGLYDIGEGIDSAWIYLYVDADANGMADTIVPIDSAMSNSLGDFVFTPVVPGDYVIVEVQPTGYLNVQDIDVTGDVDVVANTDQTDDIIPVTIDPDELDADNLFIEESECQLIVTTIADDGAGSLRAALACAQIGDTITFDPAIAGDTIVLTQALTISSDAIVWNANAMKVYLLLDIPGAMDVNATVQLEIKYINIISGHTDAPAAINNAGTVILDDVEVYRNSALPIGTILVQNNGEIIIRGTSKIIDE